MSTGSAAPRALLGYLARWVLGGVALAGLLVVVINAIHHNTTLPPLGTSDLQRAAQDGGCRMLRVRDMPAPQIPAAGPASALPLRPAVYERPPAATAVVAAVRSGLVAFQYRGDLDHDKVEELRVLQARVPTATIVFGDSRPLPYVVAAIAWHRALVCSRFSDSTLDALRLFRARHLGRGPDAG